MTNNPNNDLATLAATIAAESLLPTTTLETRLECFKLLTNYYVAKARMSKLMPDDDERSGEGLGGAAARIKAAADGDVFQ